MNNLLIVNFQETEAVLDQVFYYNILRFHCIVELCEELLNLVKLVKGKS